MLDARQSGLTYAVEAAPPPPGRKFGRHIAGYAFGFAALWLVFYGIFILFPFISIGADVVYRAKLQQEFHGTVFPENHSSQRILIFGDSKVLAGFIPDEFDRLAAADKLDYYSYNSGYPARAAFVPELREMVKRESEVPDILLLTIPWETTTNRASIFRLPWNDHDIAERIFPFRYLVRDFFSFLITSRQHGGPLNYYREGGVNVSKMLKDRGYYFVYEQSHYPNDSLPDDFHLPSDQPTLTMTRSADTESAQLSELNQIIDEHHIRCYFVPRYEREGEYALAPKMDQAFADLLRLNSSCKLLGPDYLLYANRMFSDRAHLNRAGAQVYTRAVYDLVSKEERRGR
ncbi:hypothetical protein BDD14_2868 [Edaphobacter modestus]|uniref:Uncharacterized protein n=1 Tax=Edaphobacter modestus TaxID=388466 RepID=A0A4Q7YW06_9BACT|nr:hypothetical protein BDD14_2868 [Edaphobacter modestus]